MPSEKLTAAIAALAITGPGAKSLAYIAGFKAYASGTEAFNPNAVAPEKTDWQDWNSGFADAMAIDPPKSAAYQHGFKAFTSGADNEWNPYVNEPDKSDWQAGWNAAAAPKAAT